MKLSDLLVLAYRAIRANPLRSVLTTLGVVIGVASVVALVSLGQGAGTQIAAQIKGLGSNLIIVGSQVPPNGGTGNPNNAGGPPQLFPDDAQALKDKLTGAVIVPEQTAQAPVKLGSRTVVATVIGTWSDYATARGLKLAAGEFLPPQSNKSAASLVVLGADIAYRLFGRLDPVGRFVYLKDYRFKVVGVAQAQGYQGFQNVDQFVYVPFLATQTQILGTDVVNHIYVQAPSETAIAGLERAITKAMAEAHGITDPNQYDFSVRSQSALLATARGTLSVITTLLSSIAAISLLVGGIGIMNIMLVSVTERTREIGLRKALGATAGLIRQQFLIEAVVLTLVGGILGVVLAAGLLLLIVAAVPFFKTFILNPTTVILALTVSAGVGLAFGVLPAARAARLDPIEALRYE